MPPTSYIRDTLSLSVGLQFRGTDFAEFWSCSRISPRPNLLSPSVFQMQIWVALRNPRVHDTLLKCYCGQISKNNKCGRLVLRTVKIELGIRN